MALTGKGFEFIVAKRRNSWGEWQVYCYLNGKRLPDGDYFTDDKQDAIDTAQVMREHSTWYDDENTAQ